MTNPPLSQDQVNELEAIVGADYVLQDPADRERFGTDWSKLYDPAPCAVVLPANTEEVQAIVSWASRSKVALVPSGGRTGLSGGASACKGELVVALDRLNKILEFDAASQTVRCQAGVITEQLQQFAEEKGLYYPVDFASSGSSQIGGNIGTNAGGIKVIRYGMTRNWVAGLEVVTGAGQVLQLNRGLVKNNAGYDLRQLFIGAEGTLGIVTEAIIKLTRQPADLNVLVLGVVEFAAIMDVLQAFQGGMDITAFEFFSEPALAKVVEHQGLQRPFDSEAPYYALIEFENQSEQSLDQAMALFEESPFLSKTYKKKATKYLERSYDYLNGEGTFKRKILDRCRGDVIPG